MALLIAEPFDQYTNAQDLKDQSRYTWSAAPTLDETIKKDGRVSLRPNDDAHVASLEVLPSLTGPTVFAFWFRFTGSASTDTAILWVGSTINPTSFYVGLDLEDKLVLVQFAGAKLGTGITPLTPNIWHFIEFRARINNSISANDCVVKLNGTEEINLPAGTDTQFSVESFITRWRFNKSVEFGVTGKWFDSLAIYDDTGPQWNANTFEGGHRFLTRPVNGNGFVNDFLGSDADSVDNHLQVDEEPRDDDTTFNASSTVGEIDLYSHAAAVPGNTLKAIVSINFSKKTDALPRTLRQVCRSGTTNYFGTGKAPSDLLYLEFDEIYELDPDTGLAWTEGGYNAANFGLEVET